MCCGHGISRGFISVGLIGFVSLVQHSCYHVTPTVNAPFLRHPTFSVGNFRYRWQPTSKGSNMKYFTPPIAIPLALFIFVVIVALLKHA